MCIIYTYTNELIGVSSMSVVTQISGNIYPSNSPFGSLKSFLGLLGIRMTFSSQDGSLFYEDESHAAWRRYDYDLHFYKSIASSPFHIIYSDQPINNQIGLQIVYAMLKNRPILITGEPNFSPSVLPFIHGIITKHAHQFNSVKLAELELTELSILLSKLKPIDYSLSKSEKVLINAGVKMHFRHLMERAKHYKKEVRNKGA